MNPMQTAYERHRPLLKMLTNRYRRCYRLPRDHAESDVMFHFVGAVHKHDPDRGPLGPRIGFVVWGKLINQARSEHRRRKRERWEQLDRDPPAKPRGSVASSLKEMSDDAQEVVAVLLETPAQLLLCYHERQVRDPAKRRKQARRALAKVMRGLGWSVRRVEKAFKEIRGALQ